MFLCGQSLSLRDQFRARLFCISATNIKEGNTKQKTIFISVYDVDLFIKPRTMLHWQILLHEKGYL